MLIEVGEKTLLWSHILAGTLGLIIGPIPMITKKRKGIHTRLGIFYYWLVFWTCLSAIPLSLLHWKKSWFLFFIAFFSFWFAYKGRLVAIKKQKGWLKEHIGGMLGSYIALVTALIIVNKTSIPGLNVFPSILPWILPTLIGTPIIFWSKENIRNILNEWSLH